MEHVFEMLKLDESLREDFRRLLTGITPFTLAEMGDPDLSIAKLRELDVSIIFAFAITYASIDYVKQENESRPF